MSELVYPFDDTPAVGTTQEIVPGVRWIRMPLPMALDHINLYLLEDDDGWWIIDTGMKWGKVREYWQQIFDNELDGKPVKAVFVTHMHPDHIGQAGWLCERFRIPLYMTFGEYYNARTLTKITVDDLSWTTEAYFRGAGMSDDYFEQMKENFHGFASIVEPLPGSFIRLQEGSEFVIAGNRWRVVIGSGHSPEHACLHCEDLGLMFSGDQVIPRITSNVSVMPTEPEANPLADWFDSLRKLLDLPADTLVLPAHNTPFTGLHTRLNYLIEHHQDHLLALEEACVEPHTAADLMPVLFKRKLDRSQISMALGECVAHLNYLIRDNKLERICDERGVNHYRSIDPSLPGRARPGTHHQDSTPIEV